MSISAADLLVIAESLSDSVALADDLDTVFPTPTDFREKADYWACVNSAKDTQKEIDTDLIRAAWIEYQTFEDAEDSPADAPVKTLSYRITVFHEHTFERLDQTASPDPFNARVLKTYQEHLNAIWSIIGTFQGVTPIAGLSGYVLTDTGSIEQEDNTERNQQCEFITDIAVTGTQTQLIVPVILQLEAC